MKIPNTVSAGGKDVIPEEIHRAGGIVHRCFSEAINGVQLYELDANEVAEERNGTRENNFPNTEFSLHRNSDTLLIFVGESWCYGGRHRDMITGMNSNESISSFCNGINHLVGPRLADFMKCSLYQSCWPGDQTANMFQKAERILAQQINNGYKKFRLCIQITDSHRDQNLFQLYEGTHVYDLCRNDINLSASEWLAEYDKGFLQWADNIIDSYPDVDIDIVVWKNFNKWNIDEVTRLSFKCNTVDIDWTTFSAKLDGFSLNPNREINNASQLQRIDEHCFYTYTENNTTQEWRAQQAGYIEELYDYYADGSASRGELLVNYPSLENHRLWAIQLGTAGDWL